MSSALSRIRSAAWIRLLYWIFCFSFAFDFRVALDDPDASGSAAQYLYLAAALASGGLIAALGHRHLLKLPGFYLIALWWVFIAYLFTVALLGGVDVGRSFKTGLPWVLLGLGMIVSHVAGSTGMKPEAMLRPIILAALASIVWRALYAFAVQGVTLSTVRTEVQSPALTWMFALAACSLVLRPKLSPAALIVLVAASGCVFLSVTRGFLLSVVAAGIAAAASFAFGVRRGLYRWPDILPRAGVAAAGGATVLALLVLVTLARPEMTARWTDRLFHHGKEQTSVDISWLSREAEAKAIWDILSDTPGGFVWGKGIGGSYYWDASYYPEMYAVYPDDHLFEEDIWYQGHSIWTYALFSGGFVGVAFHLAFFLAVVGLSLRSVPTAAEVSLGGRATGRNDAYLAFLPFITVVAVLAQCATSNYFDERFAGLILGLMAGLPQRYFNDRYALSRTVSDRPAHSATTTHHATPLPTATAR
ncbi:hypothetical protein BH23VER1_BH23VER1_21190 [soil metagenome]